jgi:hypothetical protein
LKNSGIYSRTLGSRLHEYIPEFSERIFYSEALCREMVIAPCIILHYRGQSNRLNTSEAASVSSHKTGAREWGEMNHR